MGMVFILARAIGNILGSGQGAGCKEHNLYGSILVLQCFPRRAWQSVLHLHTGSALLRSAPELASTMVSIVLMSVFVNELTGPPISKYAVVRGATL